MLAFLAPLTAVNAQNDGDIIEVTPSDAISVPNSFITSVGNLFGNIPGTAPDGWTLSFPNADDSKYAELAAGVKTVVSPYSMPQMKDAVFRSSPKALTRLEVTLPLTHFGITDQMLDAYAEKGQKCLQLYFSCDVETSYTTLYQDKNPYVMFTTKLMNEENATVGAGVAKNFLGVQKSSAHLFASAEISTSDNLRPTQVKLAVEMKPCDGMEDIADEGVSVGNVCVYIATDDIVEKTIEIDHSYSGTTIGEGTYVSMPEEGQNGSVAHIVFDSNNKFTRATLKDLNGNVVASSDCRAGNRAVLPVSVNKSLKTDYEITGTPTNPEYDPDDEETPGNPDDGTTTLTLELEGLTPSAVNGIKADDNADSATPKRIFNIAGQEITAPQPGQVYVVGGKKRAVK